MIMIYDIIYDMIYDMINIDIVNHPQLSCDFFTYSIITGVTSLLQAP